MTRWSASTTAGGALEGTCEPLTIESTRGILPRGGTILGSSRTNPYKRDDGVEQVRETFAAHADRRADRDRRRGHARRRQAAARAKGCHVIGVPKTIDNDLGATDMTFGFDTALHVASEAIDRLHTTAESHNRILVVEVMGRNAGWIALHSGIAGGADVILIPEIPFDIDEVCDMIRRRHERGRYFSIVVAAEGATPKEGTITIATGELDEFGHPRLGGIGNRLEREIETAHRVRDARDGARPRPARRHADGVRPRARDALRSRGDRRRPRRRWGMMASLRGNRDRARAARRGGRAARRVPVEEYERYEVLFG